MAAGERLRYELEGLDPERLFPEVVVRFRASVDSRRL
jgi:hypothetical protein